MAIIKFIGQLIFSLIRISFQIIIGLFLFGLIFFCALLGGTMLSQSKKNY